MVHQAWEADAMVKTYVLDTNVLLHNPNALFAFHESLVVLPFAVIEEIDNCKKGQDEIGRHARVVSRYLDDLRKSGRLSDGVPLPNGGTLRIELNHQDAFDFPSGLDLKKCDNRILSVAYYLKDQNPDPLILVTKDLNLRVKAHVLGISAEDFTSDKVDYSQLYSGASELYLDTEGLDRFYQDAQLPWPDRFPTPYPHCFLVVKNQANPSQSALGRYANGKLQPLAHEQSKSWGVRAKNKEQKFAMELLMDDAVKVVSLVGSAGTGKTLLALAVGLEKVLEQGAYGRLLITRPVIPMGNDLGYLPGSKEEKLRPWMQPIYDNLEYLFRNCPDSYGILEDMRRRGILEMEALTYIRGRSIPRQFILCDEAQNLTPNMIKTLVTRVGEGSKIVFTGDPDQIDHPYLDASSNGLTYLVEKLKDEEIAGHVTLVKGERSQVAEMGARRL
jgi:PhoH-like ATPase